MVGGFSASKMIIYDRMIILRKQAHKLKYCTHMHTNSQQYGNCCQILVYFVVYLFLYRTGTRYTNKVIRPPKADYGNNKQIAKKEDTLAL